jgi:hypothetical protein
VRTLVTTEWHPIMRNHNSVTFASLLSEGDSVLLIDGIGSVITNVEMRTERIKVYGLALGNISDLGQLGPWLVPTSIVIHPGVVPRTTYLIGTEMRNWGTFGLPIKEEIIFTGGFATGGLAIQHQLGEILSNGINLNNFV